jgi:putative transposase
MCSLVTLFRLLRVVVLSRVVLVAENLALRQQLAILRREKHRPRLRWRDRLFWVRLSRWFSGWRSWLSIVKPETVIRRHRQGFRLFWRWKSTGGNPGRPAVTRNIIALIQRMARENVNCGTPRIRAELHLLGHELAESTVAKYLPKGRVPPSQSWKAFLRNHVGCLASIDFFVVPTITFRLLYGFVVLLHDRRRVVHFNVTSQPNAQWVVRQLRQAFPLDQTPRYLIRDRDGVYGDEVRQALRVLGVEEVVIAPRSPSQSPFVERLIGSIRRDLLDHVIVLGKRHLLQLLRSHFDYYHNSRCHQALDGDAPKSRAVELPVQGKVIAMPMVGGLHHATGAAAECRSFAAPAVAPRAMRSRSAPSWKSVSFLAREKCSYLHRAAISRNRTRFEPASR